MKPSIIEKRIHSIDESPEGTSIPKPTEYEVTGDWQEVDVWSREIQSLLDKLPNEHQIELFCSSLRTSDLRDVLNNLLRDVVSSVKVPELYPLSCLYILTNWFSKTEETVSKDLKSKSKEFRKLAMSWRKDTAHHSFSYLITSHESYLNIIAMGAVAIPFILQDLQEHGGNWYAALRILSKQDPVPLESKGDVLLMKESWLRWGRDNGYIE